MKKALQLLHENPAHEDIVVINWLMGNECNFCCRYCTPFLNSNSHQWTTFESFVSFANILFSHYKHSLKKSLFFCLNGGEISLHPDLLEIIMFLKDNKCGVALLSNGHKELAFWNTISQYTDHICLSYHPFFSDKTMFIDTFSLLHNRVTTHVNVMMDPDLFNDAVQLGEILLDNYHNFTCAFSPLMKQLGTCNTLMEYTDRQMKQMYVLEQRAHQIEWDYDPVAYRGNMNIIYENGFSEIISPGSLFGRRETNFNNWFCYAGLEMLSIFYNGDIYPAWCFEGNKTNKIGTIFDPAITLPSNPIRCPFLTCWDYSDIMLTKRHPSLCANYYTEGNTLQ